MNGAEYIAEFLRARGTKRVYLMTGGACAFIIDAIARNPGLDYVCMQHEQAAAMAADAVWRTTRKVGVSVATSGPGATNLLTGIACSYFDSIPSIHITGQVNKAESADYLGARIRQGGFQETDIVTMAKPITKYAVSVSNGEELKRELAKAYNIALSGRMGPVLIDVPMNVQKEEIEGPVEFRADLDPIPDALVADMMKRQLDELLQQARRPVVLFGAGVGLSGADAQIEAWLHKTGIPFVASWNALGYFSHDLPNYCGQIGVYGNRGANSIVQNADTVLVLGSRLDNRQRSGNASSFAPKAKVFVVDVDGEELKKYAAQKYATMQLNLLNLPPLLPQGVTLRSEWTEYVGRLRAEHYGNNVSTFAQKNNTLSPYEVTKRINRNAARDAIVIADTGAHLCWVFQQFHRTGQTIFTAGGMSPMGYALPAAIGAALEVPYKQVVCCVGDGSLQCNIQELQTIVHYKLKVKLFIYNNGGYGIIKQFQDSYFNSRYEATGKGYSLPDFGKIAAAYGIDYVRVEKPEDIDKVFAIDGAVIADIMLHPNTLIEPKLEMGRPIHDQFPYASREKVKADNPYIADLIHE